MFGYEMFDLFIKQFWHIDQLQWNLENLLQFAKKKSNSKCELNLKTEIGENLTDTGKLCYNHQDDIQRLIQRIWIKADRYDLDIDQVMVSIEQCLRPIDSLKLQVDRKCYDECKLARICNQIDQKRPYKDRLSPIRHGSARKSSELFHHHPPLTSSITLITTISVSILVTSIWFAYLLLNGSLVTLLSDLVLSTAGTLNTRRCLVPNNYLVKEIARPVANCHGLCRSVRSFHILHNRTVDRNRFARIAYGGRPIVVRQAAAHWPAMQQFSFDFFRQIYTRLPNAYSGVDEECQFFPFRTDFRELSQVFAQSEQDVRQSAPNSKPWYIGWSNCNPDVATILRQYYQRPWFLPDDSEHSIIDWIFMGYTEIGASMHLDYVQRPSWQAQISGTKTWHLIPPPECELVCRPINVTVYKGDIILLDTNQWYHDTHIHPGEISITIGSEYD